MRRRGGWLFLAAGGFALAELVAGLSLGQFALRGRAEVAIFLAFRPWLLIAIALFAMRRPPAERWRLYALSILLASGGEALFVHLLGASEAPSEAAQAVMASVALMLLLDVAGQLCARLRGWRGFVLAAGAGAALMLVPGPLRMFERIALRGEPAPPAHKPPLTLLTGLPLIWGENAMGQGAPAAAYSALSAAYSVRPIDVATAESLAGTRLLLVAQPRPPGPAGLVAIDAWVRAGGRALILTDPALRWPSDLALGDPRRSPAYDGLGPLLAHWGLALEAPERNGLVTRDLDGQRLVMAAPGSFAALAKGCAIAQRGLVVDCRIGRGRALLIADADLLHDLLWVGPGSIGRTRAGRLADNAAFMVRKLDELDGRTATVATDRIDWITRSESFDIARLAAFTVPVSSLMLGFALLAGSRRGSAKKDFDRLIHRGKGKTK